MRIYASKIGRLSLSRKGVPVIRKGVTDLMHTPTMSNQLNHNRQRSWNVLYKHTFSGNPIIHLRVEEHFCYIIHMDLNAVFNIVKLKQNVWMFCSRTCFVDSMCIPSVCPMDRMAYLYVCVWYCFWLVDFMIECLGDTYIIQLVTVLKSWTSWWPFCFFLKKK